MCGYVRRDWDKYDVRVMLEELGLGDLAPGLTLPVGSGIEHIYPAFGGDTSRQIRGLIVHDGQQPALVDATWWFDCMADGDRLVAGKRTTFNARNLDSPYWKGSLRQHRGVVVATGLGESKYSSKKHQYLMEGENVFLLGALYRKFPNGCYSCAIITRDSHERFDRYHDKAFPLFLPADREFIDVWLDPKVSTDPGIDDLLSHPRLCQTLQVTEVKTFKSAVAVGDTVELPMD